MSLNATWLQQATRTDLGPTIVIKSEDQTQLSSAIVIKPEEPQIYLQTTDGQQPRLIKLQPSAVITASKCSMFTQTEPTNRFTQTDNQVTTVSYRADSSRQEPQPTILTYDATSGQPQVYIAAALGDKKDGDTKATEFPFCYNVNMLQKVPLQTTTGATVGTAVLDDKGCYRLDMGSSFSYNYVVNPVISTTTAFKCNICGATFTHLSLFNQHKRSHGTNEGDTTGIAQNCECATEGTTSSASTTTTDQQNEDVLQVRTAYHCDICGMNFNLPGELKSHKNAHHKDHQVTMTTDATTKSTTTKYCEGCGVEMVIIATGVKKKKLKFCAACIAKPPTNNTQLSHTANNNSSDAALLLQALASGATNGVHHTPTGIKPGHHPVKKRGLPAVTKCQMCNGSGIIFIGGTKKNTSHNSTEKAFICGICGGSFSRYSSLWSHKRLHTGDKPFKCQTCGLCFAKAAYLKNHLRVHTGEKPFKCNVCGLNFSQSPHLKNHERIHSGERPYQCEVCHKNFARHSTLWNHRRIHTGEKPYRCNVCDSKFNQATHLKNHAKVHTGEKPFKCDICEVCFADRFALKRHRAIHEKYARAASQSQTTESSTNEGFTF